MKANRLDTEGKLLINKRRQAAFSGRSKKDRVIPYANLYKKREKVTLYYTFGPK